MAIMRQSITFGGIDSADYGIYVGGEGTFNAPKRAVEMIEIPGRNGALALDKGYWENITVEYPCFVYETDLATFAQTLREFRNALKSQTGYQRLTDSIHPDEYRLAVFVDEFEVDPLKYNTLGEFDLKFNCKPQRFLTSGETATTVANNGTLTNPTAYDASPLLAVKGYGTITFNGYSIDLRYVEQGDITLVDKGTATGKVSFSLNGDLFNTGDSLTMGKVIYSFVFRNTAVPSSYVFDSYSVTAHSGDSHINVMANGGGSAFIDIMAVEQTTSAKQTAVSNQIHYELSLTFKHPSTSGTTTVSTTIDVYNNYYSATNVVKYEIASATLQRSALSGFSIQYDPITAVSTALALGNPTYIDCELGEAYMIQGNEYVSLNRYIDLGSDLPVLASGTNTFTKTNTITELKATPRWWQL